MSKPKLVILGAQGMLGMEMTYYFQETYEVTPLASFNLDITDQKAVEKTFQTLKPDLVINCAAYTNVEEAENPKGKIIALQVNGEAVKFLAEFCAKNEITFAQISTDYVFDGAKKTPYLENDQPKPLNVYGQSKLLGEQNVLAIAAKNPQWRYYIVRTSWLYGQYGPNFVQKMLHLARGKKELKIVNDQTGCPTWTYALTEKIGELLNQPTKYPAGIYHLTGQGAATWADFALEIFRLKKNEIPVNQVTSAEFPQKALRPAYSVLKNTKGPKMPSWQEMLEKYLR